MERTSRRRLLQSVVGGGAVTAGLGLALAQNQSASAQSNSGHGHDDKPLVGRKAQATVAFGQWDANPTNPFDRFPTNSDRTRNVHKVLPFEVEIEEGGAVNFIISGVHQILIYDNGFEIGDVSPANLEPGGPPLVNDPNGRIYRGLDPRVLTYATLVGNPPAPLLVQDRVESVNFPHRGRYLVVCGVLPHFLEGMHGFVKVKNS